MEEAFGFVHAGGILLGTTGVLVLLTEMFEYAWKGRSGDVGCWVIPCIVFPLPADGCVPSLCLNTRAKPLCWV